MYINGFVLEEPYIEGPWRGPNLQSSVVPEDEYFVMGDNRGNSLDSRSFGFVSKDLMIGKAMLSYWPLEQFGLAPNEEPTITDQPLAASR